MCREGLGELLQSQEGFTVSGTAEDGVAALACAREIQPDVLLIQLDLPRISGLKVLELLDLPATAIRALVLVPTVSSDTIIRALELGAKGVLQHDVSPLLLFKSIRAVARGEYWVPRGVVAELARRLKFYAAPFGLTRRECQVVSLIVQGYNNKDIATRFSVSVTTIKHHLTNIFDKTGASTRVELAVFALHHGIVTSGEPLMFAAGAEPTGPSTWSSPDGRSPAAGRSPTRP